MLTSCVLGWEIFIPATVMMQFPNCAMPWLYVLICLNTSYFLPSQNQAFLSHPYLSFPDSLLPLRSFLKARYGLRARGYMYNKGLPLPSPFQEPGLAQVLCKYLQLPVRRERCFTLSQIAPPAKEPCGEEALFFGMACMW